MNCPSCGHENREGAAFCGECAAPVATERTCPSCGQHNPIGQRFCDACAHPLATRDSKAPDRDPRDYTPKHLADKILQSKSALEGERKQVTVLFADVKGSMELAERLDPEEWHRILDRFFDILTDGVHRFKGTVNQYTGDGIMALFGAPIAHEDHAQRACYAALHLRESLRRYAGELRRTQSLNFSARMGLNSGEVVVGKIGDDLRMDYTAQGHTVGLADRMQKLAESGRVYVTAHTADLVEGFFEFEDAGEFRFEGVTESVHGFELVDVGPVRTRFDLSRARGLGRFVGRSDEMHTLEVALDHMSAGEGAVVSVLGEAGVGKSRLCYEFAQRCGSRGLTVLELRGVAHRQMVPLFPLGELLRACFGVDEQDTPGRARQKIARSVLSLVQGANQELLLLFELLNVADPEQPPSHIDPDARQRRLFTFLEQYFQEHGRREPTVIVYEDLHWMDAGTTRFLQRMTEATKGSRLLLVISSRPEQLPSWIREPQSRQIYLLPLRPSEVDVLLHDILGEDESVRPLEGRIQELTEGNPFFIEELVRTLFESGALEGKRGAYRLVRSVDDLTIPETVESVLAARIDRLSQRAKHVLQAAAIIGRDFPENLLRGMVDLSPEDLSRALGQLEAAEFIYEKSIYPEAEYAFAHPLTLDVAHRSQLGSIRGRAHARLADLLLASDPEAGEAAALIAHHFEQAGEALKAAEHGTRAARLLGSAGPVEALRHWVKVKNLAETVSSSSAAKRLELTACLQIINFGWRQGQSREDAAGILSRARELVRELRHSAADEPDGSVEGVAIIEAFLLGSYGRSIAHVDAEAYLGYATEALDVAETTGRRAAEVSVRGLKTQALAHAGRLDEGLETCERALEMARDHPRSDPFGLGFSPYLWLLIMRGGLEVLVGRLASAERDLFDGMKAATEWNETDLFILPRSLMVDLCWIRGDVSESLVPAEEAVDFAHRQGSPYSLVMAYVTLGFAQLLNAGTQNAVATLQKSLDLAHDQAAGLETEGRILAHLAEAEAAAGDHGRATDLAERAVSIARRQKVPVIECRAQLARSRVALCGGSEGPELASACLRRALQLAQQTGARALEPMVRLDLATAALMSGDAEAARRERRVAATLFKEIGAVARAADLEAV